MDRTINIATKTIVSISLAVVFFLTAAALIVTSLAELRYASAERSARDYRWSVAEEAFTEAMRLNPFNADYCAGYAGFCRESARWSFDKVRLRKRADEYYTKAIGLDPENADFYCRRGLARLASAGSDKRLIIKSFADLEHAKERDPNGFDTAYRIGTAGLEKWNYLSDQQKEFVLGRLALCLRVAPVFRDDIYGRTWKAVKEFAVLRRITDGDLGSQRSLYAFIVAGDLWEFRKEQADAVSAALQREDPKAFECEMRVKTERLRKIKAPYPEKYAAAHPGMRSARFENGALYGNGTIDAVLDLPKGDPVIIVRARGEDAGGVYPLMIVELEGVAAGEVIVNSREWREYAFGVHSDGGVGVVSVTFVNDRCAGKEDRNLFIDTVRIEER